ncbi:MAG: hypothetical protein ABSF62_20550 [Bryobacteraceae bacterium]|jgi:hypothetical protein
MKPIIMTVVLSLVAVLGVMGQTEARQAPATTPTLKCAGPAGTACTQQRVHDLAAAAQAAGKGSRASLAAIKTLSLASSDGTLKCVQTNGQRCTAEQAQSLYEIGRAINVTVSFSGSNSK